MKCTRCEGRDFDVVINSLLGHAYIECSDCKQGHILLEKLKLRPAELLGNVANNTDNCIMFACGKCKALRLVESDKGDLVKSTQLCNACIEYIGKLSKEDEATVVEMAGGKIAWSEFLNKAHTFE